MSTFLDKCEQYFDSRDFYEVLNSKRDAKEKELKKAYHKLSLLVHPDRVEEAFKLESTEKFKVLGKIYSILQDPEKRELYDASGEFDEDESENDVSWMNYWKAMFKPITTNDIKNYQKEYMGSAQELCDIKKAYVGGKGNWEFMCEMVPFMNCDNEPRIMQIVQKMVDSDEVPKFKRFFNESKAKKDERRQKEDEEAALADSLQVEDADLEKQIMENHQKRESAFFGMISNLEEKYSKKTTKRKSIKSSPATSNKRTRSQK